MLVTRQHGHTKRSHSLTQHHCRKSWGATMESGKSALGRTRRFVRSVLTPEWHRITLMWELAKATGWCESLEGLYCCVSKWRRQGPETKAPCHSKTWHEARRLCRTAYLNLISLGHLPVSKQHHLYVHLGASSFCFSPRFELKNNFWE